MSYLYCIILGRDTSCYQYDSEDESEDELFEDYGEYQSIRRQRRFNNVFNSNNCINHDKQPNASCSYTVILSAVGAIYHALLYTGK